MQVFLLLTGLLATAISTPTSVPETNNNISSLLPLLPPRPASLPGVNPNGSTPGSHSLSAENLNYCSFHLIQGPVITDKDVEGFELSIHFYDHHGNDFRNLDGTWLGYGQTMMIESEMRFAFAVTVNRGYKTPVQFAYANDRWDSDDKTRCGVGKWDRKKNRQMDCHFGCEL